MPRTPAVTDDAILKNLKRRKRPVTAATLGVPASRLNRLEGVSRVGEEKTGGRGRPAGLYALVS